MWPDLMRSRQRAVLSAAGTRAGELSTTSKLPLAARPVQQFNGAVPKSRGRRPKHNRSQARRNRRTPYSRDRAMADLPILLATDAAEARGDAAEAVRLIERDMQRRDDQSFWRPERLRRLAQLVWLGDMLPRWATSRWLLAQAAQSLDPSGRDRIAKAFDVAMAIRADTTAVADADLRVRVMDHDWVFRQVLLYERGGLHHFLNQSATADLIAGADRIRNWMTAPMGGYRLEAESSALLTWTNLATGDEVRSMNLGGASLIGVGECAIGRLVPIEGGAMFESAPLYVTAEVARRVSSDPPAWTEAVCDGCHTSDPEELRIFTGGNDFGLLTDVPSAVRQTITADVVEQITGRPIRLETTADWVTLDAAFVRAALDGSLSRVELPISPWPSVAATLLSPRVVLELGQSLGASDSASLTRLADLLPAPASGVCRGLAAKLSAAA